MNVSPEHSNPTLEQIFSSLEPSVRDRVRELASTAVGTRRGNMAVLSLLSLLNDAPPSTPRTAPSPNSRAEQPGSQAAQRRLKQIQKQQQKGAAR